MTSTMTYYDVFARADAYAYAFAAKSSPGTLRVLDLRAVAVAVADCVITNQWT